MKWYSKREWISWNLPRRVVMGIVGTVISMIAGIIFISGAWQPVSDLECWTCDNDLVPADWEFLRVEPGDGDHYILFVHGRHAGDSHARYSASLDHRSVHKLRPDQAYDPDMHSDGTHLRDILLSYHMETGTSEEDTGIHDSYDPQTDHMADAPYWARAGNVTPEDLLPVMQETEAPFPDKGQDIKIRYVGWDTDLPVFGHADASWRGGENQWGYLNLNPWNSSQYKTNPVSGGRQLAFALARYCHSDYGRTCDVYTHSTGALVFNALNSTWGEWIHDELNVRRVVHLAGAHGGSRLGEQALLLSHLEEQNPFLPQWAVDFLTANVDLSLQRSVARTVWNSNQTYGQIIETVSGTGSFRQNDNMESRKSLPGTQTPFAGILEHQHDGTLENHTLCSRRVYDRFEGYFNTSGGECVKGDDSMWGENSSQWIAPFDNHYVLYGSYWYDHAQTISGWSMAMWQRYILGNTDQQLPYSNPYKWDVEQVFGFEENMPDGKSFNETEPICLYCWTPDDTNYWDVLWSSCGYPMEPCKP